MNLFIKNLKLHIKMKYVIYLTKSLKRMYILVIK
jgi:hypothetical protein